MTKKVPAKTADQKRIDKLEDYVAKLIKSNTQLMNQVNLLTREGKRANARLSALDSSVKKINTTLRK